MNIDLEVLKRDCPMPALLHRMGFGEYARRSCRSPFREDKNASWGIFQRDGKWGWKDHGNGDGGDEITLLARWKGLDEKRDFPAILKLYAELAGVGQGHDQRRSGSKGANPFSWSECVAALTPSRAEELGKWRGYSSEFCTWLGAENLIGLHGDNWALPVHGEAGTAIGIHYRVGGNGANKPVWYYHPRGIGTRCLIFGDPQRAMIGFVFESPWDAFTVMDKLLWHMPGSIPQTCIVVTRGAGNGKLVGGLFTPQTTIYAFQQNDTAAVKWLSDVSVNAGCKSYHVATPAHFKDVNDWTLGGATPTDIMAAIDDAKLVFEPVVFEQESIPGGNVPNVENAASEVSDSVSFSTLSTLSLGKHKLDAGVYPRSSWVDRYMDYARQREESADSYLIGSVLPIVAAALARRAWLPWGDGRVYSNLFSMLAGKPGDRKSSAINQAEKIARAVIDKKQFLPDSMSAEALVDEYDEEAGGSPDKLLVTDDANAFLGTLQKTNYGERVGQTLLRLYDCKGLAEAFRRNQQGEEGTARRYISETSTSMILGATFNICQFQGHEIRSGLQRRFLYYLAEGHGRFIGVPAKSNQSEFSALCERFAKLTKLRDLELQFSPEANDLWMEFQRHNRTRLAEGGNGLAQDAYLARLNGQPNHVQKLAIIFHAAIWAEAAGEPNMEIGITTLQTAIEHSELCLATAQALDAISNREAIQADADLLLASIQCDFSGKKSNGAILLTRTDLTSRYAHHSGRRGAWKTNDLYLRLIPDLIRRSKAKEVQRSGKQSAFAFKVEEEV